MIKKRFEKKLKQSFDLEIKDYLEKPENYNLSTKKLNHRFPTKAVLATLCSACVILVIVIGNNNASKAIYNSMGSQGIISSSSSAVASSSQDSNNYVYYELNKVNEDEINSYAEYKLLPLSLDDEYSIKELYSLNKNGDIFEAYQINIRNIDDVKKITILINKDLNKQEALKDQGLKETILNGVSVIFYEYSEEQKYSATFIINNISFEASGYNLTKEEFSKVINQIIN